MGDEKWSVPGGRVGRRVGEVGVDLGVRVTVVETLKDHTPRVSVDCRGVGNGDVVRVRNGGGPTPSLFLGLTK